MIATAVTTFQVVHSLPNRVRIHIPKLLGAGSPTLTKVLGQLRQRRGVRTATGSAVTGNVVVHFDPRLTDVARLVHVLTQCPTHGEEGGRFSSTEIPATPVAELPTRKTAARPFPMQWVSERAAVRRRVVVEGWQATPTRNARPHVGVPPIRGATRRARRAAPQPPDPPSSTLNSAASLMRLLPIALAGVVRLRRFLLVGSGGRAGVLISFLPAVLGVIRAFATSSSPIGFAFAGLDAVQLWLEIDGALRMA